MFEHLTADARAAVVRARDEAEDLGHGFVGTEHLVIALSQDTSTAGQVLHDVGATAATLRHALSETSTEEDAGLDPDALRSLGIDLDDVRRSVEETFGAGALDEPVGAGAPRARRWRLRGHLPLTRRARKALELALRQMASLGDSHLGSEHLLLGILDEGDGLGLRLLTRLGVDPQQLRATTVQRSRRSA